MDLKVIFSRKIDSANIPDVDRKELQFAKNGGQNILYMKDTEKSTDREAVVPRKITRSKIKKIISVNIKWIKFSFKTKRYNEQCALQQFGVEVPSLKLKDVGRTRK